MTEGSLSENATYRRIVGKDQREGEVDPIIPAWVTITTPHHEVHEGETFHICKLIDGLADDGNIDLGITVSPIKELHISFVGACGGDAIVRMFHTPTFSGGVTATLVNMDFSSTNTSDTLVHVGPTVASSGVTACEILLPGGVKNQATGSTVRSGTEWILKRGLKYLLRLTNVAGAAKLASLVAEWYEAD